MEFIIEQNGIKRKLSGSFMICSDRNDIERLIEILKSKIEPRENFCYGWIEIFEPLKMVANLPVKKWDE